MAYRLVSSLDSKGKYKWGIAESGEDEAYEIFDSKTQAEKELKILRANKKESNPSRRSGGEDNTLLMVGGIALAFYLYSNGALTGLFSSLSSLLPASLAPSVIANPVIANAVQCGVSQALSAGVCYQCPTGNTVQGPTGSQYCVPPNF
jgi:hypothetical protein